MEALDDLLSDPECEGSPRGQVAGGGGGGLWAQSFGGFAVEGV